MKRPVFSPEQISNDDFDDMAMATFQYQYEQNSVYRSYCDLLNVSSSDIHKLEDVPYFIQFFKSHQVRSIQEDPRLCFSSSSTSGL